MALNVLCWETYSLFKSQITILKTESILAWTAVAGRCQGSHYNAIIIRLDWYFPAIVLMEPTYLQGVLLHPDGKVRQAGAQRGDQERRGLARLRGEWAVPSPQPSLQQKQSHWGESPDYSTQYSGIHLPFSLSFLHQTESLCHHSPLSRFHTGSDGWWNRLLRNSLSQSRLGKIWILPGKNKFTRS